ncbi:MAG TPA: hypothetical protein VNG51_29295 [Ktedonobacteraceae bacterium]|nr:hypothetical protein [Ktedonobacteraceae bacterium]
MDAINRSLPHYHDLPFVGYNSFVETVAAYSNDVQDSAATW